MKKILFATSLLAAAGMAHAAAYGANAVTSGTAITVADCGLLNTDASVKITLSTGNVAAYDCNSSTANIGVAVGNQTGKNKVFAIGSNGGSVTTYTTSSAPQAGDVSSAASTMAASSS